MLPFPALMAASITFCCLFFCSAQAGEQPEKSSIFKVFTDPAGHAYFPKGKESFYTEYLAAMKEPSLMPQPKSGNSFALRFTWLRSFHEAIAIRIWNDGEHWKIRGVRLAKLPPPTNPPYDDPGPGPINKEVTQNLTKEELSKIQQIAEGKEFWTPLNEVDAAILFGGTDGAAWIFERLNQANYSMIALCSPKYARQTYKQLGIRQTRDFEDYIRFGIYLLKITRFLPSNEEDIY